METWVAEFIPTGVLSYQFIMSHLPFIVFATDGFVHPGDHEHVEQIQNRHL